MKIFVKAIIEILFFFLLVFLISFFWLQPIILFTLLLIVSIVRILVNRETFVFYIICAFFGPLGEIICISFGAWFYALPQFAGIPIWLPLVWGIGGIFLKRLETIYREFRRGRDRK